MPDSEGDTTTETITFYGPGDGVRRVSAAALAETAGMAPGKVGAMLGRMCRAGEVIERLGPGVYRLILPLALALPPPIEREPLYVDWADTH